MLKGISPLVSPELLQAMSAMGHGDEIVLADTNFPGPGLAKRLLRADGIPIAALLNGILPLFPLDTYDASLIMMAVVPGDPLDPEVEADYIDVAVHHEPGSAAPVRVERHAFYERARAAYAIVMTGETRAYGNLILKKGVVRG